VIFIKERVQVFLQTPVFMKEYFLTKTTQARVIKLSAYIIKTNENQQTSSSTDFNNSRFLPIV
jgi:hypothetical protein